MIWGKSKEKGRSQQEKMYQPEQECLLPVGGRAAAGYYEPGDGDDIGWRREPAIAP